MQETSREEKAIENVISSSGTLSGMESNSRLKVLHVDDEPAILEQAKIFLEKENERLLIETATTPKKALEMLENEKYDAIVSDYQMPGMDGLEFLERVKEETDSNIPFIIFTGKGREEVAIEALNLGANRYLQKGGDPKSQYGILADAIVREVERSKSEERLDLALEASKAGLWDWNVQTGETEFNERWAEIVGYELEELEPVSIETWQELAHPEDLERSDELLEKHFAGETDFYEFEGRMKHKDGHWVWIQDRGRVVEWDDEGNPVRMVGTHTDITERKRAKDALRESEKKFRNLAQTTSTAIMVHQNDKWVYANPAAEELSGYSTEELKTMKFWDFVAPEFKEKVKERGKKRREGIEALSGYETKIITKQGEEKWFHLEATSTEYEGEPAVLVSATDITERKEAKEELEEREEHYRSIFEQFQDLYYRTDMDGNLLELSPSVEPLTGYEREELIGKPVTTVYADPADREDLLRELREKGSVENYELTLQKQEGEGAVVSANSHIVVGENGEPVGIEGTLRDITERKEAEEELKESEQRLDSLISNTPAVIYSHKFIDGEEKITYINDNIQNVLGFEPDDFVGNEEFHTSCIHPDDRESAFKEIQKLIQGETDSITMAYRFEDSSGNYHWLRDTHRVISREDNETEVVGAWWDITGRKKAEEREDFLHSLLRHDVRNKAQIVQGYLELLEDYDLPNEAKNFVSKAEKGMEEGMEIIEKVRSLRKAQEEEVSKVRIDSAIQDAVDQTKPVAEDKGIEIEVDCPGEGCKVMGGSLLNQVFTNIIENAIQHSGGSQVKIHGETTDKEVICIVEDDGDGISDEKKDKIFDRGYTTDEERGSGLGMFLVKTLLDIYEGSIEVKDSELGGARFDIHLQKA